MAILRRSDLAQCLDRAAVLLDEGRDPILIALCLRNLARDVRDSRPG